MRTLPYYTSDTEYKTTNYTDAVTDLANADDLDVILKLVFISGLDWQNKCVIITSACDESVELVSAAAQCEIFFLDNWRHLNAV